MNSRRGFTLLEIMVVVAIVGVLAAVAVANFIGARRTAERNTCMANLKQIQIVVNTWALDTGAGADSAITPGDIIPNYIKAWPKEGTAEYPMPSNITVRPVCPNVGSKPDHTI